MREQPRRPVFLYTLLLIIGLVILAVVVFAGESATPAPLPVPTVVLVEGEPAALVPLPDEVTRAEVAAVTQQSAENLQAVADDELTIQEATRDPTKSPDLGSEGFVFALAAWLVATLLAFVSDMVVLKMPSLPNSGMTIIALLVAVGVYLGMWAVLHGPYPDLPQHWWPWAASAAMGVLTVRGAKSGQAARDELKMRRTGEFPQRRATDGGQ